jgi:hypothetical protein
MRFGTKPASTLLACLLAGLAALQPACPAICCCPCRQSLADASRPDQSCRECDDHCHHAHDHGPDGSGTGHVPSQERNSFATLDWFLGARHCTCPSDCDCHLRHASDSGFLAASKVRVAKQQIASSIALYSAWPRVRQLAGPTLNRVECRSNFAPDGPSCCAVLCRFTI